MNHIEAMKQALEALEHSHAREPIWKLPIKEAITSLRQAIAEAEKQEPVAYPEGDVVGPCVCGSWPGGKCLKCPRITNPQPKREWVGLTDEDKAELDERYGDDVLAHLDAIEAKLKEKNK
jgi:hypothetical protein